MSCFWWCFWSFLLLLGLWWGPLGPGMCNMDSQDMDDIGWSDRMGLDELRVTVTWLYHSTVLWFAHLPPNRQTNQHCHLYYLMLWVTLLSLFSIQYLNPDYNAYRIEYYNFCNRFGQNHGKNRGFLVRILLAPVREIHIFFISNQKNCYRNLILGQISHKCTMLTSIG